MFRPMRRMAQRMDECECLEILKEASHGTLALSGDDGYPYSIPMSFVLDGKRILFHSALSGHKIDSIKRSEKASFAVVSRDDVIKEKYTTGYESVIVFGRIGIIRDEIERFNAISILARKYYPEDSTEHLNSIIERDKSFCILSLEIEHISGKRGLERLKKPLKDRP